MTEKKVIDKTEPKQNRYRGLKPFKKGQSGNPKGRPVGTISLLPILKRELQKIIKTADKKKQTTYAEALIRKMLKKAIIEEDVQMIKDIFNRIDGMPKQSIGLGSDEPITKLKIEIVRPTGKESSKGKQNE